MKNKNYHASEGTEKIGKILFSERKTTIESKDEIYFIHPTKSHGFIHGDIVQFLLTRKEKSGRLPEARPIRLIKRSEEEVIIEARKSPKGTKWFLLEAFGKLSIEVSGNPLVAEGDLFIGKFISSKKVQIVRKFCNKNDRDYHEQIIFFRAGVRTEWSKEILDTHFEKPKIAKYESKNVFGEKILAQTLSLKEPLFPQVEIHGGNRSDFRSWFTMTIDGADAKDLDDAISIAKYEGGDTLLGVHIADVAEYVIEKSPIDREAYLRGTSIYTPGRVIPMLPEVLSNDLCSLHPGEPKLVLSILLRIDRKGMVKESFVTEGLIESQHRGVYEEIGVLLKDEIQGTQRGSGENTVGVRGEPRNNRQSERVYHPKGDPPKLYDTFGYKSIRERKGELTADSSFHSEGQKVSQSILENFQSLYHTLRERRKKEGKILFESTECYFDFDESGEVVNIRKRERGDAHMMIEEFMVLANEEVAKWAMKRKIPFLSRIHDAPSIEKTREILDILEANKNAHSSNLKDEIGNDIEPHHIRSILEHAKSESELYRLSRLLLPKMAKAVYQEKPVRHFGLALTHYAHFTSPIRRYPDLLLHRMIKKYLHKELGKWRSSQKQEVRGGKNFSKEVYMDVHDREKFGTDKEIRSFSELQMKKWGESLSLKERSAEDVSRAVDDVTMCRYMSKYVGESFSGRVSGITESNIYVELDSGVEGSIYMVKSTPSTPDGGISKNTLHVDEASGSLIDAKGKILFRIGEPIKVTIASVNIESRRIEMNQKDDGE